MSDPKNDPKPQPSVNVELLKAHEHEGKELDPGAVITLPKDTADWLISIEVAKVAKMAPLTPSN